MNYKGFGFGKITNFAGMEGDASQGKLFLNKKEIAFYSQSADGGIPTLDLYDEKDRPLLEETSREFFEKYPNGCPEIKIKGLNKTLAQLYLGLDGLLSGFLDELIRMTIFENTFKEKLKSNRVVAVSCCNDYGGFQFVGFKANVDDKIIEDFFKKRKLQVGLIVRKSNSVNENTNYKLFPF